MLRRFLSFFGALACACALHQTTLWAMPIQQASPWAHRQSATLEGSQKSLNAYWLSQFSQAVALAKQAQYEQAIVLLEHILESHPTHGPSLYALAQCQANQGNLAAADALLERLMGLSSLETRNSTMLLHQRVQLATQLRQYTAAQALLQSGFGLLGQSEVARKKYTRPLRALLWMDQALLYDEQGATHSAIQAYQQALQANPSLAAAANNMGLLQNQLGNTQLAKYWFERACNINKQYGLARLNLGNWYANQGLYRQAYQLFARVEKYAPNTPWLYVYWGNAYFNEGRYAKAQLAYQKALAELSVSNRQTGNAHVASLLCYLLAATSQKLGDYGQARQACVQYLLLQPQGQPAGPLALEVQRILLWAEQSLATTHP